MAIISSKQAAEPNDDSDRNLEQKNSEQKSIEKKTSRQPKQPRTFPAAATAPDSIAPQELSKEPKNELKKDTEDLLQPTAMPEEAGKPEENVRPQRLSDYVGQKDLKDVLDIAIQAAKARQESLDHLLLYGPPGLGKTTMSLILASEMGVNCKITSAPALERPRDIVGLLMNLQPGDVLFIDEIHRLAKVTEEILYPAMEDFRVEVTLSKGQSARTRSLKLNRFTLVGATTKVGALTSPLRDRFGIIQRLRFYELDELTAIVLRTAQILNTPITEAGAIEIGRRSRGTPRIANRLLRRVRDFVEVRTAGSKINESIAAEALELFNVDPCGLDWTDRRLLSMMIENFAGRPVGLDTLAAATGEDAQTIEEVYEPYLLQIGYLQRTSRGRIATPAAYRHLGYEPPSTQLSLVQN